LWDEALTKEGPVRNGACMAGTDRRMPSQETMPCIATSPNADNPLRRLIANIDLKEPMGDLVDIMDLPSPGVIFGIDTGTARLGLAASDPSQRIATPVAVIARGKSFQTVLDALAREMQSRSVIGFVVGLPVNMNASEGPRAQAARAFARNLAVRIGLPVALWDERLSTAAVEREMITTGTRRAARASRIDAEAAAFILQGALDRRQSR
jgi:putative holliday junction resolvase